jgi:hypothetical protein
MSETYWLIERQVRPEVGWFVAAWLGLKSPHNPTESTYIHDWTTDTQDAVRFPRKQDAEKIIELLFPFRIYQATEHMDCDLAADALDALAKSPPAAPDGWQLVPRKPTKEMLEAGYEAQCDETLWPDTWAQNGTTPETHTAKIVWAAMLAAAPKPK